MKTHLFFIVDKICFYKHHCFEYKVVMLVYFNNTGWTNKYFLKICLCQHIYCLLC